MMDKEIKIYLLGVVVGTTSMLVLLVFENWLKWTLFIFIALAGTFIRELLSESEE